MQTHFWTVFALLATAAVADLSCTQFVPQGGKGNVGHVAFSGSSGSLFVNPATNIRATNPVVLAYSHTGTSFHFQACNSTSLNKTSFALDNPIIGCGDAGCANYTFSYIRIIDPRSGQCLTSTPLPPYSTVFQLGPQKCNPNPTGASQLFLTSQRISTMYDTGDKKSYGPVYLYANDVLGPTPIASEVDYDSYETSYPYTSWFVKPDDQLTILWRSHDTSETSLSAQLVA